MYITTNLSAYERQETSQFGEDGVIERLAEDLGIAQGTFFEFGIGPRWQSTFEESGLEGNFVRLRKRGWRGMFLDGGVHPAEAGVSQAFITPLNINLLYRDFRIPPDLDFMSIDVDGQEFWIWLALHYRPKVVVIEYNGSLDASASLTIGFDPNHIWDMTRYYGASLLALYKLAVSKEYTLVWCNGVNAMFVRDDLVSNKADFVFEKLFKAAFAFGDDPQNRPWVTV